MNKAAFKGGTNVSFGGKTQETLNDQLQVRREKMSQLREKESILSVLASNKKHN